mgnify:CR=1 FL=1
MKKHLICIVVSILLVTANWNCSKDEDSPEAVADYSLSFKNTVETLEDFVTKAQEYESANYDALTSSQKLKLIDDFIAAGENFLNAVDETEGYKNGTKHSSPFLKSSNDIPCSPYDVIPDAGNGLSVSFVKGIGDLIAETKGDRNQIQQKFEKGEIDENTYDAALKALAKNKTIKTYNFGVSAILGGGSSALSGAAV